MWRVTEEIFWEVNTAYLLFLFSDKAADLAKQSSCLLVDWMCHGLRRGPFRSEHLLSALSQVCECDSEDHVTTCSFLLTMFARWLLIGWFWYMLICCEKKTLLNGWVMSGCKFGHADLYVQVGPASRRSRFLVHCTDSPNHKSITDNTGRKKTADMFKATQVHEYFVLKPPTLAVTRSLRSATAATIKTQGLLSIYMTVCKH
jgi:hypothetical protein